MATELNLYRRCWRGVRTSMVLLLLPVLGVVYFAAHWLRFEGNMTPDRLSQFAWTLVPLLVAKILCFAFFGVYQGWSRYVTFHDLVALIKATTAALLLFALVDYLAFATSNLPRSVFMMDWAGTVAAVGLLRSMGRLRQEGAIFLANGKNLTHVMIVGANDEGESLLRSLRRSEDEDYRVHGFISDDPRMEGKYIGGAPVLGKVGETFSLAAWHNIDQILVTDSSISGKQLRQMVDEAKNADITIRVLPSYQQIIGGKLDLQPRSVSIEDLLRRAPIQLDQKELSKWIDGRTLLVTGSAGSIGSEICRQLLQFRPKRLVCVDRSECGQFFLEKELNALAKESKIEISLSDVSDLERMEAVFGEASPDIVFHAAAYKHVPLMEQHPGEAIKNIVLVTQQLADLAIRHNVDSFVMVSTDKAVNPTNVMGACKRVAERYVQSLKDESSTRFVTVRFGNVLDSAGSVIPIFRRQIARGGPVTVTHPDMTRYFMTIPEASQLVIQAGAMGAGGEIFVLDMGNPVKIVDLARDMIELSGLVVGRDIELQFVGCRPGEKLYEELHVEGERHLQTAHPKIMVAECKVAGRLEALRAVRRLKNLANGRHDLILDQLSDAVPQFRHESHSDVARANAPAVGKAA